VFWFSDPWGILCVSVCILVEGGVLILWSLRLSACLSVYANHVCDVMYGMAKLEDVRYCTL